VMFASPMFASPRKKDASMASLRFEDYLPVETRCSGLRCSGLRCSGLRCSGLRCSHLPPCKQKRRQHGVSTIRGLFAGRDAMFASPRKKTLAGVSTIREFLNAKRVNLSIHPTPSVRAFCKRPCLCVPRMSNI